MLRALTDDVVLPTKAPSLEGDVRFPTFKKHWYFHAFVADLAALDTIADDC